MPSFSVLDLCPILAGGDATQALANTLDLARHAEGWGYRRYWLAEHHNMPGIASAATAVVIGHVAGGTRTIRVGAGGVMLPNHAPLVIAEQFGTLESLYPGRINLGLGRAPGTDRRTMHALRRDLGNRSDTFQEDVLELLSYFGAPVSGASGRSVSAFPGAGLHVPVWILGSSLFGARVAAELGLPYAFASHFAPTDLDEAIALYRREFRPSVTDVSLREPHLMLGLHIVAADSDRDAKRLSTSLHQSFVALRRGMPAPLRPPIDTMEGIWTEAERAQLDAMLACSIVGSPATVRRGLDAFVARTRPDELIVTAQVFDHAARLRSFEIVAGVAAQMGDAARESLAAARQFE